MGTPLSILDYRRPVEFRIGDVIVRTWNIYSRHFLTFVLLVAIAELLPLVLTFYIGQLAGDSQLKAGLYGAGVGLLQFVLTTFAHAIVVYAAFQDLRGQAVSAAESFGQGVARLFPVLVASLLSALIIGVGCLLCLVPGLIAMAAFAVTVPACVVERLGPMESLSRSSDLTTGNRWPVLLVAAAWVVVVIVVTLAIQAAMIGAPQVPTQIATWVWQVISGSFTAVYAAILYHDLRAVREGIGIDEIASVFD